MEPLEFAEGAVKEFLIFRGFTSTLNALESEIQSDVSCGFKVYMSLFIVAPLFV